MNHRPLVFEESSMRKQDLACISLFCAAVACSESLAPANSAFGDIIALKVIAGLAQQTYSVDSSAKFSFSVHNALPRNIVIYGAGCLVTLELENLQGAIGAAFSC